MSKSDRDAKLAQLSIDLKAFALKEKVRLTKEANWLRLVQKSIGLGAIRERNKSSSINSVKATIASVLE